MNQMAIFLPACALAMLTFAVLLLIPIRRFAAGRRGEIKADDFKFGESPGVPGHVSIPNRNYMNLLELPMLFYVVVLALFVTSGVNAWAVKLAWAYVALRALHSVVHLSYNNVMHRLTLFALSNVVLITLWVLFIRHVLPLAA